MRLILLFAIGAALLAPVSRPADVVADESAAINQAVRDYAEGYYGHEPDRMQRAVSPLLSKRGLNLRPGVGIMQQNAEMLVDACRGSAPRPAPAERKLTIEVLDVQQEIASARVFSVQFNDYIHLVKRDGRWQLVSVLWHPPPPTSDPSAQTAVENVTTTFGAALAGKDGSRTLTAMHAVATFRMWTPGVEGGRVLRDMNPEMLAAGLAGGQTLVAAGAGDLHSSVLGVDGDLASSKLTAGPMTIYLHLGRIGGQWQIVNALAYRAAP